MADRCERVTVTLADYRDPERDHQPIWHTLVSRRCCDLVTVGTCSILMLAESDARAIYNLGIGHAPDCLTIWEPTAWV